MAEFVERQIAALAPLGDVLVCGAGSFSAAGLTSIEARRTIVLDPDPLRCAEVRRATREDGKFDVQRAVAGKAPSEAHLLRYNFRPASSLRPPTGIMDLFPGLHVRERLKVRVCDVAEIALHTQRNPERCNMLIVATPGEEVAILSHLKQAQRLDIFDHVLVPLPQKEMYEDSGSATDLLDLLESAGFTLMARDDAAGDVPQGHFYRPGVLQAQLAQGQAEVRDLRERLSKAENALKESRQKADLELQTLRTRKDAELARLRTRKEAELAWLRAEADRVGAQCRIAQAIVTSHTGS